MHLTFNILADYITPFLSPISAGNMTPLDKSFSEIRLVPLNGTALSSDILNCLNLNYDFSDVFIPEKDTYLVCAGTKESYDRFCEKYPNAVCLLIDAQYDFADVYNGLQSLASKLEMWNHNLQMIISYNGTIQEMLDVSEPLFNNPVFVIDYSFHLIAYTKNIPAPHKDLQSTIKDGIYPVNMVEELVNRNILEKVEKFPTPDFFEPPNYINCTMIIKTFAPNSLKLNTVCLYGLLTKPTLGSLDLIRNLSTTIEQYIESQNTAVTSSDVYRNALIADCISGVILSCEEMELRATMFDIPFRGEFYMRCFWIASYTTSFAHYIQQEIKKYRPSSITFIFDNNVISLTNDRFFDQTKQLYAKEQALLEVNNCFCGISAKFENLNQLRDAYVQAKSSISLGLLLDPEKKVFLYDDYYIYHMFSCVAKDVSIDAICPTFYLTTLMQDTGHSVSNVALLELYLNNDRNATQTAAMIHMHRNSVLYRLHRIEELLNQSLDDPDVRVKLILAIKALRYKEALEHAAQSK